MEAWGRQALVLENRPDEGTFRPATPDGTWRVACLGRVRDLATVDLVVQALTSMPENQRPVLRWAGDGVAAEAARHRLADSGLEVEIEGAFAHEDLNRLHDGVDVSIALYDPIRGNIADGALPVRMFEAAVRGVASVVNAGVLMGDIAMSEGIGVACTWNDADALVAASRRARTHRSRKRRTDARGHARSVARSHRGPAGVSLRRRAVGRPGTDRLARTGLHRTSSPSRTPAM